MTAISHVSLYHIFNRSLITSPGASSLMNSSCFMQTLRGTTCIVRHRFPPTHWSKILSTNVHVPFSLKTIHRLEAGYAGFIDSHPCLMAWNKSLYTCHTLCSRRNLERQDHRVLLVAPLSWAYLIQDTDLDWFRIRCGSSCKKKEDWVEPGYDIHEIFQAVLSKVLFHQRGFKKNDLLRRGSTSHEKDIFLITNEVAQAAQKYDTILLACSFPNASYFGLTKKFFDVSSDVDWSYSGWYLAYFPNYFAHLSAILRLLQAVEDREVRLRHYFLRSCSVFRNVLECLET